MDLEDLDIDIKIEITSIEDLRKVRKELERIAKAKKDIDEDEDEWDLPDRSTPDPLDPDRDPDPKPGPGPQPDFPDFPDDDIFCGMDTFQSSGMTLADKISKSKQETMGSDDFHTVGQLKEEKFDGRNLR